VARVLQPLHATCRKRGTSGGSLLEYSRRDDSLQICALRLADETLAPLRYASHNFTGRFAARDRLRTFGIGRQFASAAETYSETTARVRRGAPLTTQSAAEPISRK
jgi:hypothetical protein